MGEDIIDMDLNMEGGRKETDEEGKEIAAGTDRSASEQTAPYEAEAAGTERHIEDDEEIPQLIMEHSGRKWEDSFYSASGRDVPKVVSGLCFLCYSRTGRPLRERWFETCTATDSALYARTG